VGFRDLVRREDGMTLVEVLVAILIFGIVGVAFYQLLFSVARGTRTTQSVARVTEEARLGFNRMVRDTREGQAIVSVASDLNTYNVHVDFDADGDIENSGSDIEDITYSYDPATGRIRLNGELLMSGVSCVPDASYLSGCRPVFDFLSDRLEYDWGGPGGVPDGVVTWKELDDAPNHGVIGVGNANGELDGGELPFITSVVFNARVTSQGVSHDFQARAQLRNVR
jgi:prepilin-type N-terminal cleavage/methylation domain-containing protein